MYIAGATSSGRVSGLVSGMDVDATVKSLMTAQMYRYDAVYQQKVLDEWRMEAYREVNTELAAFKSKYFDYLSDDNLLSSGSLALYTTELSTTGSFTARAGSGAATGSHTVQVLQLAKAAQAQGTAGVTAAPAASSAADYGALAGTTLTVTLDGTDYKVTLTEDVDSAEALQTALDDAVGAGKLTVSESGGCLSLDVVADSGVYRVDLSGEDALTALGFDGAVSNRLDTTATLGELSDRLNTPITFNSQGELELTIGSSTFTFDSDDTLEEVMAAVNESDAGVTMTYDPLEDRLSLTADSTGAGKGFSLSEGDSGFFNAFGVTTVSAGCDSITEVDGVRYTRSSNEVAIGNITYSLLKTSTEAVDMTVTFDADSAADKIAGFVEDYNALIDSLSARLTDEYDRDYPPLTTTQQEVMTDDEIESWNEQAKVGLLNGDSILKGLLQDLRTALYQNVSGTDCTLFTIGVKTGSYDERGKLVLDETALKEALEEDPEAVITLFTQRSETYPAASARKLSAEQRTVRTEENGLMWNLFDQLEDRISTVTDTAGNKGTLLEKSGKTGDSSATDNVLYKRIQKREAELEALEDWLSDKEEFYYDQFTAMETYISEMNAQLSAFQASFSG